MPFITIPTGLDSPEFYYTISTPSKMSAKSIDQDVPTVLFLHGVLTGQAIFHPQFADRYIRRYNLVAIDSRVHGETNTPPEAGYGPIHAAEDVYKIMQSLQLPPCHVVSLSAGSSVALELTVAHPEMVLSLFLMSTPPFDEPQEILQGRREIAECWGSAFNEQEQEKKQESNEDLGTMLMGGLQFTFNNQMSNEIAQLLGYSLEIRERRNSGPNHAEEMRLATVDFFTRPRSRTKESLSNITCVVKMIHFSDDIAYGTHHSKDILAALKAAGVESSLEILDGPRYGSYTRPDLVNPVLHAFLLSVSEGAPPLPRSVMSPFEEGLKLYALNAETDSDSDTDSS